MWWVFVAKNVCVLWILFGRLRVCLIFVDGQTFVVKATRGTTPVWYHHEDRGGKVVEVFTAFEVNSLKGRGISEFLYRWAYVCVFHISCRLCLYFGSAHKVMRLHLIEFDLLNETSYEMPLYRVWFIDWNRVPSCCRSVLTAVKSVYKQRLSKWRQKLWLDTPRIL